MLTFTLHARKQFVNDSYYSYVKYTLLIVGATLEDFNKNVVVLRPEAQTREELYRKSEYLLKMLNYILLIHL